MDITKLKTRMRLKGRRQTSQIATLPDVVNDLEAISAELNTAVKVTSSAQGVRNFGDLVSASSALTYDAAGRVATRTDGRGIWTLTYDAAGRLVTEVCLDVTRTHSYGTDGRWSGVVES